MHIPHTQEKVFKHDKMSSHVDDKELSTIIDVGVLTKKEFKKDDMRLSKEPNKEWKLNEKMIPNNKNVYHYQWQPSENPHLNRNGEEDAWIDQSHTLMLAFA
ncbi:hypothetical protein Tco_0014681 [Tanacetum coccineum]